MAKQWKFDQQFEQTILKLLLKDIKFLSEYADIIKVSYFSNKVYQDLVTIIFKYFDTYLAIIPQSGLMNELNNLKIKSLPKEIYLETLEQINNTIIDDTINVYIGNEILKWCNLTELKIRIEQASEILSLENPNVDKARQLVSEGTLVKYDLGMEHKENIETRIALRQFSKYEDRIPTLIKGLDRWLRGGVSKKELMIIGAAPNVGKSAILVNIAVAGLQNEESVLYLSCELDDSKIAERVEQRICLMTDDEIMNSKEKATKRLKRFYKLSGSRLFIKSVGSGDWNVNNIRAYLQQLKLKEDFIPTLLVIDYLDELKSSFGYDNYYASETEITASLVNIAKEFDIPVVTATQASKEAVGKKIVTEKEIAQCFQKIRKADIILTICQTMEEEEDGIARIYIAKNRNNPGKHKQIPIKIDFKRMYMTDLEGEEK